MKISLLNTIKNCASLLFLSISLKVYALTFTLTPQSANVVGEIQNYTIQQGDTFATVARKYDLGYLELVDANPNVDPEAPKVGTIIIVPTKFILPATPHKGLIVNLSELRLYYYPPNSNEVITYPVGIGREGEDTPEGVLTVIQHIKHPAWHVPESIRKMRAKQGVQLSKMVPPGPDNPLGDYAMRLSNMTYLIHGTNDPLGGIGRRSSSGCLRLYPEDIAKLFFMVPQKAEVRIIDNPYKLGWTDHKIYLESHIGLKQQTESVDVKPIMDFIANSTRNMHAQINWPVAKAVAQEEQGIPQVIGVM